MAEKTLRTRFGMILTNEELTRLILTITSAGDVTVSADVHGMTCKEAKEFLKKLITLIRGPFHLIVIHGFHRGTSIRDMVRRECLSEKVAETKVCEWNDGVTEMDVRALWTLGAGAH
jgi:hypothetical protein